MADYYLNHTASEIDAILTKVDGVEAGANVNVQVDWNQTTTTADDYIKNKPIIPAAQVNSDWDAVSGVAQILNKPTIPDAQIQSDWNQTNTESKDFIKNKPTIPAAQVNSDWEASSGVAEILHKPTLGTAAAKDYTTAVLGLSNDLVTSSAVSAAISTKADLVDGKVPSAQLPSYVDDSIEGYYYEGVFYEDSEHTTVIVGEAGKIYIDLTANKSYRWTGTVYARIDECPAFGETAGTVYEGNKGKQNADSIGTMSSLTTTDKSSLVAAINEVKGSLGTAAVVDTTTSITSGGTGLPTSGTVYTDQQRQDAEIGSLVDRGAKNLFKAEAPSATSQNGAIITDNGDGTYGVTTNGNPTTAAVWVSVGIVTLADGIYIMTGGADSEKCLLAVNDDGEVKYVGPGTTTISGTGTTGKQLYIHVPSGRSIGDTLTVKPMICTQGDYVATQAFVQYSPTNRELYEMIGDINTVLEEVL